MDSNGNCHFLQFDSLLLVLAVKAKPLRGAYTRSLDCCGEREQIKLLESWDDQGTTARFPESDMTGAEA